MNNYFIEDFTENNYRRIIREGSANIGGYCGYENCKSIDSGIIMRHDIDISVHRALRMAEIEREEGAFATYFIFLHSEFYNFFEKQIIEKVKQIISLGGFIGLHFEPNFYDISKGINFLEEKAILEQKMIEDMLGIPVNTISFHNPDVSGWDALEKEYFGSMFNVYGPYMKQNFEYCSDSNGYWRFNRLEDVLQQDGKKIQILTHPAWWTKEIMYPRERIELAVKGRAENTIRRYDVALNNLKRNNIKE